jgi:hypothetical protein
VDRQRPILGRFKNIECGIQFLCYQQFSLKIPSLTSIQGRIKVWQSEQQPSDWFGNFFLTFLPSLELPDAPRKVNPASILSIDYRRGPKNIPPAKK